MVQLSFTVFAQFQEGDPDIDAVSSGTLLWADLNKNGLMDLVVAGQQGNSGSAELYLNDGEELDDENSGLRAIYNAMGDWADVDRDGDPDLVLAGQVSALRGLCMLYRNNQGRLVAVTDSGLPENFTGSVAWGDIDGDGDPDLLLAGTVPGLISGTLVRLYENKGGKFEAIPNTDLPQWRSASGTLADINLDGYPDLIVCGVDFFGNYQSRLYLNQQGILVATPTDLEPLALASYAWGDFNNDGYPDLLMTGQLRNGDPATRLYRNDQGKLVAVATSLPNLTGGNAAWIDMNHDGQTDLLITGDLSTGSNGSGRAALFVNQNGTLVQSSSFQNQRAGSIAAADVFNNRRVDVLVSGMVGNNERARLYLSALPINDLPSPPESLTFEADNEQLTLRWSPGKDSRTPEKALTYNLRAGTASLGENILSPLANKDGKRLVVATGNTGAMLSKTFRGLPPGIYYCSVQTIDQALMGSSFSEEVVVRYKIAPATPGAPVVETVTATTVLLSWATANGASEYILERSASPNSGFTTLVTLPADTTSYLNEELNAGQTYYYRLRATNAFGTSPNSPVVSALTLPLPPQNFRITQTAVTSISLAWSASAGATGYRIERKLPSDAVFAEIAVLSANTLTYNDTNRSAETVYQYRIRAFHSGGSSAFSPVIEGVTLPLPVAAPTGLSAQAASATQIDLTWQNQTSNAVAIIVERRQGNNQAFQQIAELPATSTSYQDQNLQPSTQYGYRIQARSASTSSSFSNIATATTLSGVPVAPAALTATAQSATAITITWQDTERAENYLLQRSVNNASNFTDLATLNAPVARYEDQGLQSATTYFYRIRASNTFGNGAFSQAVSATTFPEPPPAPQNLTAIVASPIRVNLFWLAAPRAQQYLVERANSESDAFAVIATLPENTLNYADQSVSPNSAYRYRIRAVNPSGSSPFSNEVAVATPNFTLVVENPVGGSTLLIGSTHPVSWRDNLSSRVRVTLLKDQQTVRVISQDAASNSAIQWQVPQGLPSGVNYQVKVMLAADTLISALSAPFTIRPNLTGAGANFPAFTTTFPEFIYRPSEVSVSLSVSFPQSAPIRSVRVYQKGIAEPAFSPLETSASNGNTFSATLPFEVFDPLGIEYFLEMVTNNGNLATSDTGRTYIFFEGQGLALEGLRTGSQVSDYQLISIPLTLENPSARDILEPALGTHQINRWRLFTHLDGQNQEFPAAFSNLETGQSYALITRQQGTVRTGPGHTVKVHQQALFTRLLQPGWNQIASPYPFSLQWLDIQQFNQPAAVLGNLRIFDSGFQDGQTLEAWQGGFVFVESARTIRFPLQPRPSANRRIAPPTTLVTHEGEWTLPLALQAGAFRNTLGGIGMHPDAAVSKDAFDQMALPFMPGTAQLVSTHTDYFHPWFTFDVAPAAEAFQWDFEVVAQGLPASMQLRWEPAPLQQLNGALTLVDLTTQKTVNMKQVDTYTFQFRPGHRFRLVFGDMPTSVLTGAEVQLFPNPVRGKANIALKLPDHGSDYQTRLSVHDLAGKEVAQLVTQAVPAGGWETLEWEARFPMGKPLAKGIYLLRLTATAGTGQQYQKNLRFMVE
jgi:fibronectin type 3 domain-containing protein